MFLQSVHPEVGLYFVGMELSDMDAVFAILAHHVHELRHVALENFDVSFCGYAHDFLGNVA